MVYSVGVPKGHPTAGGHTFQAGRTKQIVDILSHKPLPLQKEAECQQAIADVLREASIPFEEQFRLDAKNRIDFLVHDIGIEVKVKGSAATVARQLKRYEQCDQIRSLILVTRRSLNVKALPFTKPLHIIWLSKTWL